MRTLVAAGVGALAGRGFLLTLTEFTNLCTGGPGRTGCGASFPWMIGPIFACWLLVAAVLIHLGFRLTRSGYVWPAAGIGSLLWFVSFLVLVHVRIDVVALDEPDFVAIGYLILPCVAFVVGALFRGRPSTARGLAAE
uniref:hypothetical protein n=1 Tax=Lentzea alba TaxID=2714351 RepID=UPI0039BF515D